MYTSSLSRREGSLGALDTGGHRAEMVSASAGPNRDRSSQGVAHGFRAVGQTREERQKARARVASGQPRACARWTLSLRRAVEVRPRGRYAL